MATAWFGPCPHCRSALSYLEGVTGSTMNPVCPRCRAVVSVERATLLMADYSRPTPHPRDLRRKDARDPGR
ncbi:MAG: hypothetical protein U0802_16720 [Candidatus Binatia bacterium]